ncbi:MAG TPA: DUF2292 domain-containing protein [Opitutae bacterium]|nr:hypothetical protein [Puniceicoccaceae bacterium]HBR92783.1 DUF2292 domain-containing protein [Opitutae bacterium]|tara:strand:+ start:216 stop:395 length:180 start_codon:yes stop_codon:yes gene_type:complete
MAAQTLTSKKNSTAPDWLQVVRDKVGSIRFGVVQIVVHEGKVTQIEVTEKTRLDSKNSE